MSAYGFKARWEAQLLARTKLTTLRVDRKDGRAPRVGEQFSAFVGMRTKQCRRLFNSTISEVHRVKIIAVLGESEFEPVNYRIYNDGGLMTFSQGTKMAKEDGFKDLEDFTQFFEEAHQIQSTQFSGWLIRWNPQWTPPGT